MSKIYLKSPLCIATLCGFFLTLHAFQGTFKKSLLEKPLKISLKTKQFLKQTADDQQQLLVKIISKQISQQSTLHRQTVRTIQSLLDVSHRMIQTNMMTPNDVESLFEIIEQSKKILFEQQARNPLLKSQNVLFHGWWKYLLESLTTVQTRGCEHDLNYLKKEFNNLALTKFGQTISENKNITDYALIARCVGICSDMIHHCEGVMISEYDLLVLCNIIVILVFSTCS